MAYGGFEGPAEYDGSQDAQNNENALVSRDHGNVASASRRNYGGWPTNATRPSRQKFSPLYPDIDLQVSPRISGSRYIGLEGLLDQQIFLKKYHGECQPSHKGRSMYVPCLRGLAAREEFPAKTFFIKRLRQQLVQMESSPERPDNLYISVRLGKLYLSKNSDVSLDNKEFETSEFNAAADDVEFIPHRLFLRSIIPSDISRIENKLMGHLKAIGFEESSQPIVEYKVNVLWCNTTDPSITMSLRLDRNLKVIDVTYDGQQWFTFDMKCSDHSYNDIRFQLETKSSHENPDLLRKLRESNFLQQNELGEFRIANMFKGRVSFIRQKQSYCIMTNDSIFRSFGVSIKVEFMDVIEHEFVKGQQKFAARKGPRKELAIKVILDHSMIHRIDRIVEFMHEFVPFCCGLERICKNEQLNN